LQLDAQKQPRSDIGFQQHSKDTNSYEKKQYLLPFSEKVASVFLRWNKPLNAR